MVHCLNVTVRRPTRLERQSRRTLKAQTGPDPMRGVDPKLDRGSGPGLGRGCWALALEARRTYGVPLRHLVKPRRTRQEKLAVYHKRNAKVDIDSSSLQSRSVPRAH